MHALQLLPCSAKKCRPLVLTEKLHHGLSLKIVRRLKNRHPWQASHQRHIFQALLAVSIVTDGNSRVAADDPDVGSAVGNGNSNLIKSSRDETCEGTDEGNFSRQ